MQKVLVPLSENKDRIDRFCGTTLFAGNPGRSVTVPTHRLPDNAGNASEDTLVAQFPLPSAAHYTNPLFAPLSALRHSLWMRCGLYSRLIGLSYVMLFIHQLCAFVKNFFASQTDRLNIPGQHPGQCR